MDRILSISEAAKLLSVSEKTIRNRIKRGEIIAELVDGKYAINESDLLNTEDGKLGGNDSTQALLAQLKSENEYLRDELSKAQDELSEVRQRSDTIILQLTRQFEQQTVLLEDMRNKPSFWQRLKTGLVRFATPPPTEQKVTEQRN